MSKQPATKFSNEPLGGISGDWHHRVLQFHIPLALVSAVVITLWMSFPLFQTARHQGGPQSHSQETGHQGSQHLENGTPSIDHTGDQIANANETQNRLFIARFTTASGYVALGLLGLTLLIGPANLFLRRRTPISTYLARDVGMWAAIMSMVHVIVGFFVHDPSAPLGKRILFYFFAPDGSPLTNDFGWGNWTGLIATVIVVGLLTISSDFALRKLKARNWKNLQRLNYVLFVLVMLHAIFYGVLLRVTSIPTFLFALIVTMVVVGQAVGISLWRRRHVRKGSAYPPQTLHQ